MIDAINHLTGIQFAIFIVAVLLTLVQLTALAAHILRGVGASLIPGIIAVVLWIVLFSLTR